MGKRTAAEADVVDRDDAMPPTRTMAHGPSSLPERRPLLESPVPLAWEQLPARSVEPSGACHTRKSTAVPKQCKLPLTPDGDEAAKVPAPPAEEDVSSEDDDGDHLTELTTALPPLVAPRPCRMVSPDLLLFHGPNDREGDAAEADAHALHALSLRRRAFRPIGAGRPDVDEITSPPARAMNPVVLDARFKNMQRLDLQLDARDAPLQPFHRPSAQRRYVPGGPATVVVFGAEETTTSN
jgi:hypothetical protein